MCEIRLGLVGECNVQSGKSFNLKDPRRRRAYACYKLTNEVEHGSGLGGLLKRGGKPHPLPYSYHDPYPTLPFPTQPHPTQPYLTLPYPTRVYYKLTNHRRREQSLCGQVVEPLPSKKRTT